MSVSIVGSALGFALGYLSGVAFLWALSCLYLLVRIWCLRRHLDKQECYAVLERDRPGYTLYAVFRGSLLPLAAVVWFVRWHVTTLRACEQFAARQSAPGEGGDR